jgi:hypothetical protein
MEKKEISLLDEIKIQTDVIIPILYTLRKEFGKEKADILISNALRPYIRSIYHKMGELKSGTPFEKWEKVWSDIRPRIGGNVEREFLKNDDTGRYYNVNHHRNSRT